MGGWKGVRGETCESEYGMRHHQPPSSTTIINHHQSSKVTTCRTPHHTTPHLPPPHTTPPSSLSPPSSLPPSLPPLTSIHSFTPTTPTVALPPWPRRWYQSHASYMEGLTPVSWKGESRPCGWVGGWVGETTRRGGNKEEWGKRKQTQGVGETK